jgi:serine/threonine protein kinase
MENYEQGPAIGNGSFGQVYIIKNKSEDKDYVIKKIKTRDITPKDRENIENEVGLLKTLGHPNIVSYKESFMDDEGYLCIIMAYCDGGDMYNKIRANKNQNFQETLVLDWLAQLALALHYLHEKKILHRDLKTQNIFIKDGCLVFGDFGIAKV